MSKSAFKLKGDLQGNLGKLKENQQKAIVASAHYVAPQAESFMRTQASWTDRTGNARNGLRAKVYVSQSKVAIVLYHSVSYGVWLEIRWGGKYAVIEPAMAAAGPLWVEAMGKLMFKEVASI